MTNYKNLLTHFLSVTEAAERYQIDKHTVQEAIRKGRLIADRDCFMKGGVWLILDDAAHRLWGWRIIPVPPGHRLCKKCLAVFPATEEYFDPYCVKGVRGLTRVCKQCLKLQDAGYFQRNKDRIRPIRKVQMRDYRAKHPEREAAAVKRYRLKRSLRRNHLAATRQEGNET